MRRSRQIALLVAAALALWVGAAPATAAQPVDRWDKWLEGGRHEDVAEQARKWLDKNEGHDLVAEVRRVLAEAEYHRLSTGPTVAKVAAYRAEFPDGPREHDAYELEAKLSLYAASEDGTEASYRDVVDRYVGTDAATEAHLRAEEAGFNEGVASGTAEALGRYLGNYPDSPNFATAKRLWRTRTWEEAEAEDTLQAWMDLRINDSEHPRAEEAYMREQALALAELSPGASTDSLMKLARRYEGTPTGWETLRRAVGRAGVRMAEVDGTEVLTTSLDADPPAPPADGHRVEVVSVDLPGRLPDSATVRHALEVRVDKKWFDWNERAALFAGSWGGIVPEMSPRTGPALHWLTSATPCALPDVVEARVRVRLQQERKKEEWTLPVDLFEPCGGVLPVAVRYAPGGVVDTIARVQDAGIEPELQPVALAAGGLAWNCAGAIHVEDTGLWLTCSGWQVSLQGQGVVFRPPPLGVASATGDPDHAALAALPADDSQQWLALDVPIGWHFGDRPACPLPEPVAPAVEQATPAVDPDPADPAPEPATEAPAPDPEVVPEPPAAPLWVHPSLATVGELTADLDGDGAPDRLIVIAPHSGHPAWLVIKLAAMPAGQSWTTPWSGGLPAEGVLVVREGCGYQLVGPEG